MAAIRPYDIFIMVNESAWTFMDFIDSRGSNAIRDWLKSLPKLAQVRINVRLQYLAAQERLERPHVGQFHGECEGLYEIVVRTASVQYGPIGCYGPGRRDFTLLAGAIEKGGRLEHRSACATAHARKQLIESEGGHTREHDFS